MRAPMPTTALAVVATAVLASAPPPLGHQTVTSGGVAVTSHVLQDDEPKAGAPSTIVIVKVRAPRGARFAFKTCGCRVKISDAAGKVLLNKRTGKRTPFTFPTAAAYEITVSGSYRVKNRKTRRFSAAFAIRAS